MSELGFNSNASDETKEAFIKHLIHKNTGVIIQTPTEKKQIFESSGKILEFPIQLKFEFEEEVTQIRMKKINQK